MPTHFLSKLMQNNSYEKAAKKLGYFYHVQKLPNIHNHPNGENSPSQSDHPM
jgi:DNA repair protein RadC